MAEETFKANGKEMVEQDRKRSVTDADYVRGDQKGGSKSGYLQFVVPGYTYGNSAYAGKVLPEVLPAYNRYTFFTSRDTTLLSTPFYEALWAGAIATAITKALAWGYQVESSKPLRQKRAHQIFQTATAGIFVGFIQFLSAHLRSFLMTGRAVVEIERATKAYGSRVIGIHHLNPLRCIFTDDIRTPVIYLDRMGKIHELRSHQVMLFADQIDPTLGETNLVESAGQRAYHKIGLLAAIERYLYEKITGKRALSLEFIQGITAKTMMDAMAGSDNALAQKGAYIYKGVVTIPIPGDIPIQRISIPLAEVPDGFDPQELRDEAKIVYSNAIGLDPNDIDPRISQAQSFGSGAQSIILQEKASGKGLASWRAQWIQNVHLYLINDTVTRFAWHEENLTDEQSKANIKKTRAETRKIMQETGDIDQAQSRNLAVSDGDLPRELIAKEEEAGAALRNDEKPAELTQKQLASLSSGELIETEDAEASKLAEAWMKKEPVN